MENYSRNSNKDLIIAKNKIPKGRKWIYPSQIPFKGLKEGDSFILQDGTVLKAIEGEIDKSDPITGVYCSNGKYECYFCFKQSRFSDVCRRCESSWVMCGNKLVLVKVTSEK